MEKIMSVLGTWTVQTDGILKGIVGADLRAYCLAGSEDDEHYEVHAGITVTSGKSASIIVLYTEDLDFEPRYVECVIDVANQTLHIDLINGSERITVASRNYASAIGTEYLTDIFAKIASDESYYVVFTVNGIEQIRIEDLGEMYAAGMHGFACEGTLAAHYSKFSQVYVRKSLQYTSIPTVCMGIKSIDFKELVGKDGTHQDYYDYLNTMIEQASRFIDGETQRAEQFFKKNGIAIIEHFDGVGSTPPSCLYEFDEETDAWQDHASRIYLSQRPVLSVTTIEINSADIGETDAWTTETKFRWHNRGEIVFAASAIPAKGTKNVRITYKGGYAETPLDIEMACMRLIINSIHKLIADRTATFVSFARPQAINFATPDILTPDIKMILNRYKLLGYGAM